MGAGAPQVVSQRLVDWVFIPKWSPDGSVLVYATNPNALRHAAPVLTFRTVATGAERDIALSPTAAAFFQVRRGRSTANTFMLMPWRPTDSWRRFG